MLPIGVCVSLSVPPWSFEGFLAVVVTINAGKEAEAQSQQQWVLELGRGMCSPGDCEGAQLHTASHHVI